MDRLDLPGRRIAISERGHARGEPVVLLHCSGASSAQWRSLMERLAPAYRTLAPDLHGYGRSDSWPGDPRDFGLAHEAAIVHALLDGLDTPVHLVGHSFGGAVALHVARTRPERLRSLALIEPVALHLLRDGDAAETHAARELTAVASEVTRALARGELDAGYGHFVDYWAGAGAWAAIPGDKREALARQLPKIALDFQAIAGEPATLADFRALRLPTLVLHGERTVAPTRRICELLAAIWPDARHRVVAGAGHMLPITHRAEVDALVAAHLEAHASGRVLDAASDAALNAA